MSLTPKQERFCQCIVSGMSGKDSYLTAYNSNSDNAAMIESTKLLAREDVQGRLKELRKPIETLAQTNAISDREKKRSIIWEELENARSQQDHAAIARYLDILNKMDQEYININKNVEGDKTLDTLDADTLRQLAGETETPTA